jgi:hypothetical protein
MNIQSVQSDVYRRAFFVHFRNFSGTTANQGFFLKCINIKANLSVAEVSLH